MPVVAIDTKVRTLSTFLARYYPGLTGERLAAASAALMKANPKVFEVDLVPVGTVVFLPAGPERPAIGETDEALSRSFYVSIVDALGAYGTALAEKISARERELKAGMRLVEDLQEKLGDATIGAKLKVAAEAQAGQFKEDRTTIKSLEALQKDLKELIKTLP